jgi:hypothetical protein
MPEKAPPAAPADVDPHPEHTKLRAIKNESQAIGAFLEWLREEKRIAFCTYREAGDNGEPAAIWKPGYEKPERPGLVDRICGRAEENPDYESWPAGYQEVFAIRIPNVLAEYFEIDLDKIEDEKRAMLEELRAIHKKP